MKSDIVDVDDAVHQLDGVERIVGAGVVDQRQAQAAFDRERQRFQDLRDDVLGRDEVDVVAAAGLQVEHHSRQLVGLDGVPLALPTGLVVLAEDAAQVAPAEEDGSGAAPAAQAVFFAEVREVAGYDSVAAGLADREPVGQAVDVAVARAERTIGQLGERLFGPASELARLMQAEIGRLELPPHELTLGCCGCHLFHFTPSLQAGRKPEAGLGHLNT